MWGSKKDQGVGGAYSFYKVVSRVSSRFLCGSWVWNVDVGLLVGIVDN